MLFLLVLLLAAPQDQPANPEALEWFAKGESLIGTPEAYSERQANYFRKAVELAPDFAPARYNLILVFINQEQLDPALEQLTELVRLEPGNSRGYTLRSGVYLRQGNLDRAAADIDRALAIDQQDARPWILKGRLLFQRTQFDQALEAFQKAQQLDPAEIGVYFDIAMSHHNLNHLDEAATAFRKYLEVAPADADARFLLGVVLRQQGEFSAAEEELLRAEELRPGDADTGRELALNYMDMDKLSEAKKWLKASDPNSTVTLGNLGLIALEEDKLVEAESFLRKAVTNEPGNAQLWAYLGDVYFRVGDENQAQQAYSRAVSLGQDDFATYLNLGTLWANRGENARSKEMLLKAAASRPQHPAPQFFLGLIAERMNDPAAAQKYYLESISKGGKEARMHFRLAVIFSRQLEKEKALKHLGLTLEQDAEKYLPLIQQELLNVQSDFDSIRYTTEFAELLGRYKGGQQN
jgi:tetratricopeptide (TPR) repeat protein